VAGGAAGVGVDVPLTGRARLAALRNAAAAPWPRAARGARGLRRLLSALV
jgi:hypothetical protein